MAQPDEPEQADRAPDRKPPGRGPGGRSASPRPAWDAATYGRPDDTRRRPSQPTSGPPVAEPVVVFAPPEPHYAETLRPETLRPEALRPEAPRPDRRPAFDPESYYPAGEPPAVAPPLPVPVPAAPRAKQSRAGRDLPAAIAVGVGLGAAIIVPLFTWKPAFLGVIAVAVGIGIWELCRALSTTGARPPLIPLVAGGAVMTALAWWGGADYLTFGLILTVLTTMVWRLTEGFRHYARDVAAAALVAVYVPFLGGFAAMLASHPDGARLFLVTILAVVLSDTGGYAVGAGLPARLTRHPMAPSVSPGKSWEGLAGSLLVTATGCALFFWLSFDLASWKGALFGLAVSVAAVVGDLCESMVKRALGIKDMSRLLPGHGGIMDRLDSVLFAAPTAYILLTVLLPSVS